MTLLPPIFAQYLAQNTKAGDLFPAFVLPVAQPVLIRRLLKRGAHACHIAGAFEAMAHFSPRLHRPEAAVTPLNLILLILAAPLL